MVLFYGTMIAEYPIFMKMVSKWKELVSATEEQSFVIDIPSWTSRATLDAIGEGMLLTPISH
jgi:hypothetical protein